MESEERALARIAYNAYCDWAGWKSMVTGDALPPFDDIDERIKVGWIQAAMSVRRAVVDARP